MTLYEFRSDTLEAVPPTAFRAEGISERDDLQRLIRDQIEVVVPDALVLSEEFGDWEDSRRRIDLLAVDKQANLVVVELKTVEDGGHMELQALRYAAMVSSLTFDQAVEAHDAYLRHRKLEGDARARILDFLDWPEADESAFGSDVRIVLVSPSFSKELTTAVLWLNERELDIRCVRLQPYKLEGRLLADIQQVVPLPEAEDYQVKVRNKERQERAARRAVPTVEDFWNAFTEHSDAEQRLARDLLTWASDQGLRIDPLRAGISIGLQQGRIVHYLFKVRNDADIVISYQYLKTYPPFDAQSAREELRRRLCEIPGVDFDSTRLGGKPRFPLTTLAEPSSLQAFKDVWMWAVGEIRRTEG